MSSFKRWTVLLHLFSALLLHISLLTFVLKRKEEHITFFSPFNLKSDLGCWYDILTLLLMLCYMRTCIKVSVFTSRS